MLLPPANEDLWPPASRAGGPMGAQPQMRALPLDDELPPLDPHKELLAKQALDALDMDFAAREETNSNSPLVLFPRHLHPLTLLLPDAKRAQTTEPHGHQKWRSTPPVAPVQQPFNARRSLAEQLDRNGNLRYAHEDQVSYEARMALRSDGQIKAQLQRWWKMALTDLLQPPPPERASEEDETAQGQQSFLVDMISECDDDDNSEEAQGSGRGPPARAGEASVSSEPTSNVPTVSYAAYARLYARLYKHLLHPFDVAHARRCATADWRVDCKGQHYLGRGLFVYAIFEICDAFVSSTAPAAYASWLRETLDAITDRLGPPEVRRMQAVDGSAYLASDEGEHAKLVLKPVERVQPSFEATMRERKWRAAGVRMANTSTGGGLGGAALTIRMPSPPPVARPPTPSGSPRTPRGGSPRQTPSSPEDGLSTLASTTTVRVGTSRIGAGPTLIGGRLSPRGLSAIDMPSPKWPPRVVANAAAAAANESQGGEFRPASASTEQTRPFTASTIQTFPFTADSSSEQRDTLFHYLNHALAGATAGLEPYWQPQNASWESDAAALAVRARQSNGSAAVSMKRPQSSREARTSPRGRRLGGARVAVPPSEPRPSELLRLPVHPRAFQTRATRVSAAPRIFFSPRQPASGSAMAGYSLPREPLPRATVVALGTGASTLHAQLHSRPRRRPVTASASGSNYPLVY